jgi:hypothetical protein
VLSQSRKFPSFHMTRQGETPDDAIGWLDKEICMLTVSGDLGPCWLSLLGEIEIVCHEQVKQLMSSFMRP